MDRSGNPVVPTAVMTTRTTYTTIYLELTSLSANRIPPPTVDRLWRMGLSIGPRATLGDVVEAVASEGSGREAIVGRLLALGRARGDLSDAILVALHPTLLGFASRIGGVTGPSEDEQSEILVAAWTAIINEVDRLEPDPVRLIQHAWDLARGSLRRHRAQGTREVPRDVAELLEVRAAVGDDKDSNPRLLETAVKLGAISPSDAELIGLTRVGGVTLAELSRATGVPRTTLASRRSSAERAMRRTLR